VPVDFGTLLVIVLAGLGGPLLAVGGRRAFVPVVVGEIVAGVIVGPTVLDAVQPTEPVIAALGEVGFAMLMLSAGMHLPLRDPRLGSSLRGGFLLALAVAALAVPAGLLAAQIAGGGHAAIYAVVLASSSAAVLLPALEEAHLEGPQVLAVIAQVAIADVATIVAVPIVLQPGRASHALLGGLLVAGAALLLLGAAQWLERRSWVHSVRHLSKERHWALDLRLALLVLFLLAWIAQQSGTSVLIAGFGAGLMVAAVGGPKRLSTQVRGLGEGFFVPLFFVVLGARLDLGGLVRDPGLLALALALAVLNVAIHGLAALLLRRPLAGALAASAQLGVPAAVASIGLGEHVLSAPTATAIVGAALASLGVCTLGVARLARAQAAAGVGSGSPSGSGTPAAA
jgi:Kef-type K+ transport system membrane component KefB